MYNSLAFTILLFFIFLSFILILIGKLNAIFFFIIVFSALVSFFIFRKIQLNIFQKLRNEFESRQEKINLLKESIGKKENLLKILPAKAKRLSFLFNVSQKLTEVVDPEGVFEFLINTSRDLFPQADNVLLFILKRESLNLVRSLKKKNLVIKEKKGDILDKWILRRNLSLLVEDLVKDFRFDYNQVIAYKERDIHSFVASPLSIGEKIMGTLRVESENPYAFSLDDLRLLRSICDLGAVVLQKANFFKRVRDLAIRDSLTSLFLREYFFTQLKQEISRSSVKKAGLGIIMLDIDNFKKINDTYGHIVGDLVLKRLAKIMTEVAGSAGNLVSRFGGEEFIIFIVECNRHNLFNLGETIRKKAESSIIGFRRKKISFTVSLGAVLFPRDGKDMLELIDKADRLIYQAKREGKNKLCLP